MLKSDSLNRREKPTLNCAGFHQSQAVAMSMIEGPKNLKEFEDRLGKVMVDLNEQFFGVSHKVCTGKSLKKDKSPKTLVQHLLDYESCIEKEGSVFEEILEPYCFLKVLLERDALLVVARDEYLMGICRDRSGLSLSQKNQISVQCVAQVLWYLEGSNIPTIEAMTQKLMNRKSPFYGLLGMERFQNPRTIKNWIGPIFPLPTGIRKVKQAVIRSEEFARINTIETVYSEKGINFLALRFSLISLARILKIKGWEVSQIVDSLFVKLLVEQLHWYPRQYAVDWILEGFEGNGSIFES